MSRYLTVGLLLLLAAMAFAGCRKNVEADTIPSQTTPPQVTLPETWTPQPTLDAVSPHAQLICAAQSQEEAQSIADLYGIALVDWGYGVASFYTEEDPREVIRRGQEKGWAELSLNRIQKAF